MQMCRNDADVEDIVQEVMITMYRSLGGFEGKSSLSTWLYRIATNAFLMHERRRRRYKRTFVEHDPYEDGPETFSWYPDKGTDGFTYVHEREILDSLSKAVDTLPHAYQQVLLLRRRDGLSLKEVSRREKVTVSSVKSRQYRAMQMLKEKVGIEGLLNS